MTEPGSWSEDALISKLNDLNSTQASIQNVSAWCVQQYSNASKICKVWWTLFQKQSFERKLTYLYLLNDVAQNSKRRGSAFCDEFSKHLVEIWKTAISGAIPDKTLQSMRKLLNVWKERRVFHSKVLDTIFHIQDKKVTRSVSASASTSSRNKHSPSVSAASPATSASQPVAVSPNASSSAASQSQPTNSSRLSTAPPGKRSKRDQPPRETRGSNLFEELAPVLSDAREPPESEEILRALEGLRNTASTDASARKHIASLPPEVSDVSKLPAFKSKEEAKKLLEQVDAATVVLQNYNGRLDAELEDRKRVALMLHDFMNALRGERAMAAQSKLDEYRSTLDRVEVARNELVAHLQKLPDMSRLFEQLASSSPVAPLGGSALPLPAARTSSAASRAGSPANRPVASFSATASKAASSVTPVRRSLSAHINAPVSLAPEHPSRHVVTLSTASRAPEPVEPAVTPTTADSPLSIPSDI